MTLALTVGVLVAGAVFLVLTRGLVRIVLGFVVLGHAANLTLLAAAGASRRGVTLGTELDPATTADALPQAFVLTAIVISLGLFAFVIALLRPVEEKLQTLDVERMRGAEDAGAGKAES
jgi:multicomponent Na+:H+ antiporter subunit C